MSDIIASFEIDKIGPTGPPGPGVVAGGTAGQVLAKIDSTDYNTHWIANNVTGAAGGVLSGTYPNPGFDPGALGTLGAAAASDLNALTTTVQNLTFSNIGGQLVDSQLPPDLALTDPGFDAVAIFTEGTGLITLAKVTESRLSIANNTTGDATTSAHGFQPKGTGSTSTFYRSDNTQAAVTDANLSVSDVTNNNVSTSAHGFAPKAPNDATKFLDGTGAYSVPASGAAHGAYAAASPPTTDVGPFIVVLTNVPFGQNGDTSTHTIFTVPSGRTFICTGGEAFVTGVTGGALGVCSWSVNQDSGTGPGPMTAVQASQNTIPTANVTMYSVSVAASGGPYGCCPAGSHVQYKVGTLQASTTVPVNIFVRGYYAT